MYVSEMIKSLVAVYSPYEYKLLYIETMFWFRLTVDQTTVISQYHISFDKVWAWTIQKYFNMVN